MTFDRWRTWAGLVFGLAYLWLAFRSAPCKGVTTWPPPCLLLSLAAGAALASAFFCWRSGLLLLTLSLAALLWLRGPGILSSGRGVVLLGIYAAGCLAAIALGGGAGRNSRLTQERYRLLAESAFDGIILADERGAVLWANGRAAEIFRRPLGELLERGLCELLVREDAGRLCHDLKQGKGVVEECRIRAGDGAYVTVEISARRCSRGWLLLIVRDVTERIAAEERLRESLREKETLLKEIHHRVKNNLQIICSIFELKARQLRDPATLEAFRDSLERVHAIALLHETLYRSRNLSCVDAKAYVEALVRQLASTYADGSHVRVRMEVEEFELDLDTAMPCGLILTELVTNAFRHAFPGGREGEIFIRLATAGRQVSLTVADDGVGLPESAQARPTESLGWQLVPALARQLGARIHVDRSSGTCVTIAFELKHSGGKPP